MEGNYRGKYRDQDRFLAMILFSSSTGLVVFYISFYKRKQVNVKSYIISMQAHTTMETRAHIFRYVMF
jgi:hypothetical protein